ncbi:MAG: TetR/AcrR family transcriptional regulator [Treponema sp.]|nr:TetR/AcrR family transcriptional regulator [Treponema sp.]
MGITERREREKTERRRAILNCAKELIFEHGVERIGMEDIARKAELSKATLYLYFSGKEILFSEICEESARAFLKQFKPYWESGLTGISALKRFWRSYVELFGDSNEIVIIFNIRNYLKSWPNNDNAPDVNKQHKSHFVDAILDSMKTIIDQCKAEGTFDPDLDSALATRLILSVFSLILSDAVRTPFEPKNSEDIIREMTIALQIMLRGFAKEGVNRSLLDITNF